MGVQAPTCIHLTRPACSGLHSPERCHERHQKRERVSQASIDRRQEVADALRCSEESSLNTVALSDALLRALSHTSCFSLKLLLPGSVVTHLQPPLSLLPAGVSPHPIHFSLHAGAHVMAPMPEAHCRISPLMSPHPYHEHSSPLQVPDCNRAGWPSHSAGPQLSSVSPL